MSQFKNRTKYLLIGHLSKTKREIDLLIEETVVGYKIRIVIECKNWKKPLDVADVEQFVQKLNDLRIYKGVIIAKSGFTKAAKEYVKNTGDINLHVLKFDELKRYQGFFAFAYRGIYGAIITPPNGWATDAEVTEEMILNGGLCLMYPMELDAQESFKQRNFIYLDIPELDEIETKEDLLDIFLKHQEDNIKKHDTNAHIAYKKENSNAGDFTIRITKYPLANYTETAGILKNGTMVVAVYGIHKNNEYEEYYNHIKFIFDQITLITLYGSDRKNSHKDWSLLLNRTSKNANLKTFYHN
ncbi:restriction endonuclease [Leptospira brenneri]|uniref:restriction endonuclease n=1 Tax=Leptospira brenneri TaxID=2023182 RepID=UPI003CC684F5